MKLNIPQMSKRNEINIVLNKYDAGTNTLVDVARQKPEMASESLNLIQVQDGIWQTRWGTQVYGSELEDEAGFDGVAEYIASDGTKELIAVGSTSGKVFKSEDGGAWSELSGATFTAGNTPFFLQIRSLLYITNGVDSLARYNGTDLDQYSALTAPALAGTPLARTTLTAGNYTYYYTVTALNEVGETVGSTEASITVNKKRDAWTGGEKLTFDWDAVTDATRYQVYVSEESGFGTLLASTTDHVFEDDGTLTPNPYIEVPDDNTTGAPKFRQMVLSGNRIWATADPDNKYRVYFSGVGQYMGYFSPFYGGGYIDLEKGGRDEPVSVVHYRTGKGDSIATVLTKTPEGRGSIWQIALESVTVDETTFIIPSAYKVLGSTGANAPLAVINAGDNVVFTNKQGAFFLRNKPQIFNVLSTDEASVNIRPSWRRFTQSKFEDICAYYYDAKIFFSAARSDSNDTVVIYDTERNNWTYYWDIGVKQFLEYTDSNGNSRLLGVPVSGNQLWEFNEGVTNDLGEGFNTSYISPLLYVNKDRTSFAKTTEAIIEVGRAQGEINLEILGITKDGSFKTIGTRTINTAETLSEVDFAGLFSEFMFSDSEDTAVTYSQSTITKRLRLRDKVNAVQAHVYSTKANTKYSILNIQVKGRLVPTRSPSAWRN